MIIIIEGPDSSGKTTLIQQLAEEFKLARAGTYNRTEPEQYQLWAESCPHSLIMDRWPAISDLVYGTVLGRGTWSSLETAQNDHFLVYCRPRNSTILNTVDDKPQMEGVVEHTKEIIDAYDHLMDTLCPDGIYDYQNPRSYTALVAHLSRHLA